MRCSPIILSFLLSISIEAQPAKPNIVLIMADDLGYGDIGVQGAKGVKTPRIDALAMAGRRFTQAHSSASTCTPTRFSLLTGRYALRQKGTGVAPPDGPCLIAPGTVTLPSLLKQGGYATAVIGKWHLGLGSPRPDWSGELKPGPLELGFDHAFLLPTTNDRVPQVLVLDRRVQHLDPADPLWLAERLPAGQQQPTGLTARASLKMDWSHGHNQTIHNGVSRIGFYGGASKARFRDEDLADQWMQRCESWIAAQRGPFFLLFASHDLHVPRLPHERFKAASTLGPRGNSIAQLDWCVGRLQEILQHRGQQANTLILLCSDNGPVLDDGYRDDAVQRNGGHRPAGPFSGGKYTVWEGGTRTPFIAHWPGRIKPGVSDALICTIDLPASMAALAGVPLPKGACSDSVNVLSALLGEPQAHGRDHLLTQDNNGNTLALRKGRWKLIRRKAAFKTQAVISPVPLPDQPIGLILHDLIADPTEQQNLATQNPEVVRELSTLMDQILREQEH